MGVRVQASSATNIETIKIKNVPNRKNSKIKIFTLDFHLFVCLVCNLFSFFAKKNIYVYIK